MAIGQISTSVTIINDGVIVGYDGISFTNMGSSAESIIAAGSGVEVSGAMFKATTDTTPNASSWTAIATASTAYLILTPSGTTPTQILTASYTITPPTWDTAKQGWYGSAPSTIRYIFRVYKNDTSSHTKKIIMDKRNLFFGEREVLTSASASALSWIVPACVTKIDVTVIGGGGGGGGGGGSGAVGGGGGGGAGISYNKFLNKTYFTSTDESFSYSIGQGGAGGAATTASTGLSGATGGSTIWNAAHTCVGCAGGKGGNKISYLGGTGGKGGLANNSYYYQSFGFNGGDVGIESISAYGGNGGGSIGGGGGGRAADVGENGWNAYGYGGGGGGGGGGGAAGGSGMRGAIIIEY